jgi:hypothetical protein
MAAISKGAISGTLNVSRKSASKDCLEPHWGTAKMKRIILAVTILAFAGGSAMAASCTAMAVGKDGKPLAGAAKTASIKKCCEGQAVGKDGKPLAGAAKTSFMKKCQAGG